MGEESWVKNQGRGIIGGPTEVTGRRRVGRALASTKQSNSEAVRQQPRQQRGQQ